MTPLDAAFLVSIFLLAYTAQALTGFGSSIIAITLGALLLPLNVIMPVAVALNIPFCAWMIWRERQSVHLPMLRQEILPIMILGSIIGALSSLPLHDINLKRPLGVLIIVLAVLELQRLYMRVEPKPTPLLRKFLILASGFTQGLYGTGGPLLATAMAGSGLGRTQRRATMMVVWMVLNTGLTINFLLMDRFTAPVPQLLLWLLPISAMGLWIGNRLHHVIQENPFRLVVNLLLLASGAALLT